MSSQVVALFIDSYDLTPNKKSLHEQALCKNRELRTGLLMGGWAAHGIRSERRNRLCHFRIDAWQR